MPFFGGGGGGGGDYHIDGTNIKGGNGVMPAIIGDNNMALGNGAGAQFINTDRTIAIGNGAAGTLQNVGDNVVIGIDALSPGDPLVVNSADRNVVIGNYAAKSLAFGGTGTDESVIIGYEALNTVGGSGVDAEAHQSVLIGAGIASNAVSLSGNVGIGHGVVINAASSVAIGDGAKVAGGVAIGYRAESIDDNIVIGQNIGINSQNNGNGGAIVIGNGDRMPTSVNIGSDSGNFANGVVIGAKIVGYPSSGVVIGCNLDVKSPGVIVGENIVAGYAVGIVIGNNAGNTAKGATGPIGGGEGNIVIGPRAGGSGVVLGTDALGIYSGVAIGEGAGNVTGTTTGGGIVIGTLSSTDVSNSGHRIVVGAGSIGNEIIGNNISAGDMSTIIFSDPGTYPPNELHVGRSGGYDVVRVGGIDLKGSKSEYHFNTAMVRAISGASSFSAFGVSNTVIGTPNNLLFSNASVVTANPNVYLYSAATAGASCGVSSANAACITPGSFGNGGFEFAAEFAINDSTGSVGNNGRFFVGLSGDGTAPNSNPSSWSTALAGIGSDAGDAEASIFYNVFFGTAVKIPLGVDFPIAAFGVPALWSVSLAWKPGDTVIKCAVKRRTNTATFTHNEDIPLIDSGFALFAHVWRNNAAVAAAVRLAVSGYSVKNYVGWDSPT